MWELRTEPQFSAITASALTDDLSLQLLTNVCMCMCTCVWSLKEVTFQSLCLFLFKFFVMLNFSCFKTHNLNINTLSDTQFVNVSAFPWVTISHFYYYHWIKKVLHFFL